MKATLYGLTKNKNDIHVKSQLEKMLAQVSEEGAAVIDGANIAAETIYGKSIVAGSIEATQIKAGAITSDHITANGIVADKIKTGILRSTNGASWLNLNDGTFSYANGNFTFQNGKMVVRAHTIELGGEEVPTKTQTEEYADNLGETLQGQIDTSIKSTEVEYYSSTSNTSPVGGSWSTTAPAWQEGRFMWSRTKITPNKGSIIYKPNATGTNISGATGNSAKIVTVTPSAQLFWRNQENAVTPATITVDGSVQNTTISEWQYSVNGGSFTTTLPTGVTRSGNKVSLTGATVTARTIAVKALDASGNTDTTTIAIVQDGVKGVDGSSGPKGENAIVGILTNESITVPASESGAVTSFAGANGTFEIYDGITRKTGSEVTYSVSGTPSGITVSINATTGIYTISAMTGGTSVLSGNATLQAVYNGVTIQKVLTVTKAMTGKTGATGSTGASGSDAKIVTLTSSAQIFAKNESGAISPSSIIVEGVSQNTSITAWEYSVDGGTFSSVLPTGLSRTGNVVSITGASVTAKSLSLRAKDASGVSDVLSIAVVQDGAKGLDGSDGVNGADAYTVVLSNEAHTFAGNTTSALAGSVTVNVIAYKGATRVGATIGAIAGSVAGMTTSIASNGATTASFTVSVTTAMVSTNGLLTIPITVDGKVFSKTFSFTLALKGDKGADGSNGSAGADAKVIIVNPSAQIFTKDANGNVTPSTVTIDGTSQNVSISTWEYSTNGGAFSTTLPTGVTRSGNTVTITGASMTAKNISVRASGSGVSDTTTIAMVQDGIKGVDGNDGSNGADAYTVVLSNESHTFAGNISNALAGSTKIDVIAYKGNTRVGATIGTISGLPTAGMTAPISGNGGTTASFTVSATTSLTSPNGVLTVPITVDGKLFTKTFSYAISFKGQTGQTGQAGQDGKGIQSTDVMYQNHTNGTTAPTGVWSSTVPAPVKGQYLWTRTITTYTDNSTIPTYSVAYSATDGENGVDGKGIVSTTVNYQLSSSGTVTPTGSWLTSVPTPVKGQYLWTRTVITYTSGTPSTSYSTSYYATDGQKGDKGDTGSAGADAKIVTVTPSAQIFARNAQGAITPSSITVDGIGQNTTISIWQYSVDGGTFATGLPTGVTRVGNQVTVNGSSMTAKTIAVKAIDSSGNSDTTTIAKVQDGSDGITGAKGDNSIVGYLTNESVTLGASNTGVVSSFATASGTFRVFDGITEVTTNAACVFSLNSSTGVTLTINSSGVYTVTAMSADTATAEFKAVYKGITITKAMSLSKSRVGATGSQGAKGEDGKGISSAIVDYQNHTNGTTAPTGTWSSTIPTPVKGQYLWTRTITTYTDNSSIPTYAVSYNALDGQKGSDGATGVGISSTSVHYQLSTNGSTTPTGTWSTTVPTPVNGQFLWTRTVVSYTNGTSSTAYSTSYYATDGQKGDKGDTGPKGPDGISPIVGFLTNESITLPASDAGVVSSFAGATGTLNVYEGTALRNTQATYSVVSQSSITVSITQSGVYTVSAMTTGASVLSGTATLRAVYGGVTIDKILTITKALAGPQGAPSITYSWVTSAGMSIDNQGNLRQSAGQNSAWTEQAYTNESYTGGAFLSFKAGVVGNNTMFGLNTDPATDSNYTSIDYAYYMNGTAVGIYESGTSRGSFGTYAVGDTFQIVYDGVNVKYYHAGVLDRTVAAPANLKLHIDSSFYNISAANAVTDIYFGPSGSVGATGSAGQNATSYWINASVNAIKKDVAGNIVPNTITFSGFSKTGTANPVAYAGRFIIQTSTDGVSYTTAYTSTANQSSYTYTIPTTDSFVKARYYLAGGTSILLDEQTIPVLVDAEGIEVGGRNLVVRSNELAGKWIDTAGQISTGSGSAVMNERINVEPNQTLTFTKKDSPKSSDGGFWRWSWFNKDGIYISRTADNRNNFQWVVPSGAYQIQVSYPMDAFAKLEKGNKATDWTEAPEDVEFTQNKKVYNPVRYIRDWLKGSSANTSNHWCEIMVNDTSGANVAQGKTVTTNGTASTLNYVTDGLVNISYGGTGIGKHYVEIDLGSVYNNIASVSIWHYYPDNRTYYETRTEVSEDGVNWYPLFDSLIEGEYAETEAGQVFPNTKAKSESLISALNTAKQLANTTSKVVINGGNITAGSIKDKNSRNTINLDNGTFTLANGNIVYNGSTLNINAGVSFSSLDTSSQNTIKGFSETAEANAKSYVDKNTGNLVNNPAATGNISGWTGTGLSLATDTFEGVATNVLKSTTASDVQYFSEYFKVDPSKAYEVSLWLKKSVSNNSGYYVGLNGTSLSGTVGFVNVSNTTGAVADNNATNFYFRSGTPSVTWQKYVSYIMPVGTNPLDMIGLGNGTANAIMKSNTDKIRIRFLNWSNAGTTRDMWVAHPKVVEVDPNAAINAALSKNLTDKWAFTGKTTINGGQVEADTITATQIAANTITATQIASRTITTDRIVANAITANEIASGTITATEIKSRTITTDRIVANAITANEIASGTITATEIKSRTITTDRIATNAITANEINVANLSALSANLGNVTAGTIKSTNGLIDINLNTGVVNLGQPLTINFKPVATKEDVDNISVGGVNLVKNTAMTTIWDAYNSNVVTTVLTDDGTKATWGTNLAQSAIQSEIPSDLVNGEKYVIRLKARGTLNNFQMFILTYPTPNYNFHSVAGALNATNFIEFTVPFTYNHANKSNFLFLGGTPSASGQWLEVMKGSVKLEKGNVPTAWTEAPEDVEDRIRQKADAEATNAEIEGIKTALEGTVSVDNYEKQMNDYSTFMETVQTDANNAKTKSEELDTLLNDPDNGIVTNLGEAYTKINSLEGYLSFDGTTNTLTLARTAKSSTKIMISDTSIDFMDGTDQVASITNQYLKIERGIFASSVQVSKHIIKPDDDDPEHLVFTYLG